MTDADIILEMLDGLESRWRFSKSDNMLDTPPTDVEMTEAIWDAVGEINSTGPQTMYSLSQMYEGISSGDLRWKTLLYYGAAKNIFQTLMAHWNSEGFDAEIGDLSATSKFGDFASVLGDITTQFDDRLEKLKTSSQKYIRGIRSSRTSSNNIITSFRPPMRF